MICPVKRRRAKLRQPWKNESKTEKLFRRLVTFVEGCLVDRRWMSCTGRMFALQLPPLCDVELPPEIGESPSFPPSHRLFPPTSSRVPERSVHPNWQYPYCTFDQLRNVNCPADLLPRPIKVHNGPPSVASLPLRPSAADQQDLRSSSSVTAWAANWPTSLRQ